MFTSEIKFRIRSPSINQASCVVGIAGCSGPLLAGRGQDMGCICASHPQSLGHIVCDNV